jgi:hypothetical protein
VKSNASSHILQYVGKFKDIFTSDGTVLFGQACGKSVVTQKCYQITLH